VAYEAFGLKPGQMYQFRVSAINSVGSSGFSVPSVSFSTSESIPAKPEPPICSEVYATHVKLKWALADHHGSVIKRTRVRCSLAPSPEATIADGADGGGLSTEKEGGAGASEDEVLTHKSAREELKRIQQRKMSAGSRSELKREVAAETKVVKQIAALVKAEKAEAENQQTKAFHGGFGEEAAWLFQGVNIVRQETLRGAAVDVDFEQLEPGIEYIFQIAFENYAGWGPVSDASLVCKTLFDVPFAPMQPIVNKQRAFECCLYL
jgi:hypothetical protein